MANENNMVHMDTEQRGGGGGWEYVEWPAGMLGSGGISYKPWSSFGGTEWKPQNFWDERIKTYFFTVNEPGIYRVMLRSAAPHTTEHNDCWVSLPESGAQMTKNGFDTLEISPAIPAWEMEWAKVPDHTWFKVYQNQGGNQWNTGGYTKDFDGHTILTKWLKNDGTWYSVRIAGRSTQFAIDRIIVFKCETTECAYPGLRYNLAKSYTGPQSACGGFETEILPEPTA